MRGSWLRYAAALGSVLIATLVRVLLTPWLGEHSPFTIFFVAVAVSAWYGGFWPGIVATFLGALTAIYFFTTPPAEIKGDSIDYLMGLGLYLFAGMVLALLCESLRAARRRVESEAAQAVARQRMLEEEMVVRARTENLNAQLNLELQDANRRKDEFLAMLAHELRNPLAPLRSAVQVMRLLSPPDSKLEWSRDVIERQVNHLARLVDDLLDVSRLMRGMVKLKKKHIELSWVIAEAVETTRPLIDAKGHELTVSLPAEPVQLDGDLTRSTQVFVNLLNNAAKYTDAGGHIVLRAERAGAEVIVRVQDNGQGMKADLIPHVFDLFTQGDRALARSEGGLGIGLTLVRNLVGMHGGQVEAHSAGPGQGSEFVVHLPVLPATTTAATGRAAEKGDAAMAPCQRILVVDDKPDAADSLALLLRVTGHNVRTAYDGPTALNVAHEFAPDIVFLDLGMPGMDGFEVARRLRAEQKSPNLLLVALTGYNQEDDLRLCQQAGFDMHLCKPADLDVLQGLLNSRAARPQPSSCEAS